MSVEKDLRTYLKTRSGITDIIGTGDDARIYAMQLPQKATFPALTFMRVGTPQRTVSHSGDSSLTQIRLQYSCWAETYEDAKDLAAAIVVELQCFSGTAGSATIRDSFHESEMDINDPDAEIKHVPIDFMIRYHG